MALTVVRSSQTSSDRLSSSAPSSGPFSSFSGRLSSSPVSSPISSGWAEEAATHSPRRECAESLEDRPTIREVPSLQHLEVDEELAKEVAQEDNAEGNNFEPKLQQRLEEFEIIHDLSSDDFELIAPPHPQAAAEEVAEIIGVPDAQPPRSRTEELKIYTELEESVIFEDAHGGTVVDVVKFTIHSESSHLSFETAHSELDGRAFEHNPGMAKAVDRLRVAFSSSKLAIALARG